MRTPSVVILANSHFDGVCVPCGLQLYMTEPEACQEDSLC